MRHHRLLYISHMCRKFRKERSLYLSYLLCNLRVKTNKKYTICCARVYKSVSCQLLRCNLWSSVKHGAKFLRVDCFRGLFQRRFSVDCESIKYLLMQLTQLKHIKTRIQCSTSDKNTCVEPFCYFTKNETDAVFASYGCKELTKPLEQINVSLRLITTTN